MLELIFFDYLTLHATGFAAAFVITILMISLLKNKLPRDMGRKFAVEGALSEGKARGAGAIFVCVYAVIAGLFSLQTFASGAYLIFILFAMITGFMDDASEKPWKDYKKAVFDLLTAAGITAVVIYENGTTVVFELLNVEVVFPVWLYAIISVGIVWLSINVTNCTDGVDGLSSSVGIVTLGSFALLDGFISTRSDQAYDLLLFCACLMGYMLFNAHPSTVLMGDAGSRALGTVIAIAALRSGDPFLWIPFGLVFILDGGLGLCKLFLGRFFKIKILKNIRTPLHDHVRKNLNWSNTQTGTRFTIIQTLVSAIVLWLAGR